MPHLKPVLKIASYKADQPVSVDSGDGELHSKALTILSVVCVFICIVRLENRPYSLIF